MKINSVVIGDDIITVNGNKEIKLSEFKPFANRKWNMQVVTNNLVGYQSGLMSWDEYFEDEYLFHADLVAFLTKNIRRSDSQNANSNNTAQVL